MCWAAENIKAWQATAGALLGCLLADLVFDPALPPERKTLLLLRQRVSLPIPELKELLEAIYAKGSGYGFDFPAQLAGNLKDIAEKQFSGFYGEAGNATVWPAVRASGRATCFPASSTSSSTCRSRSSRPVRRPRASSSARS